jgi:hypothetical protein
MSGGEICFSARPLNAPAGEPYVASRMRQIAPGNFLRLNGPQKNHFDMKKPLWVVLIKIHLCIFLHLLRAATFVSLC